MAAQDRPICHGCGGHTRIVRTLTTGLLSPSLLYWLIEVGDVGEPRYGQPIEMCDTCHIAWPQADPSTPKEQTYAGLPDRS